MNNFVSLPGRIMKRGLKAPVSAFRFARKVMLRPVIMQLEKIAGLAIIESQSRLLNAHPNPLNRCGMKVFSQSGNDGITCAILPGS